MSEQRDTRERDQDREDASKEGLLDRAKRTLEETLDEPEADHDEEWTTNPVTGQPRNP